MTSLEKLNKANDDYHEAVNDILMDKTPSVTGKAEFGTVASTIFALMEKAKKIIVPYYEEA